MLSAVVKVGRGRKCFVCSDCHVIIRLFSSPRNVLSQAVVGVQYRVEKAGKLVISIRHARATWTSSLQQGVNIGCPLLPPPLTQPFFLSFQAVVGHIKSGAT